ncbi:MAG: carboxypeptidase regulatory-like domain-containing protein [Anaerolineae bacterium]|nr:carboxypeptidase regulatory-like domain-containing protein [Anaerolineae bacterium]
MNNNNNRGKAIIEIVKAIGAVLGVPLALFAVITNFVDKPITALIVAIGLAVLMSIWVVYSGWTSTMGMAFAWLGLIVIVLAGFVLWPKTIMVEGIIRNTSGNPVSNVKVVFFDRSGKRYETSTDVEGHYEFTDVPNGRYQVEVNSMKVEGGTEGILVRRVQQNITINLSTASPVPTDTLTPIPPPHTPIPLTDTPVPPTYTPIPKLTDTPTPKSPTDTPVPQPTVIAETVTNTPIPPADTPLPTPTLPPMPPLVVADFDSCAGVSNLQGLMGAAYNKEAGDFLLESYTPEQGAGCVVRLEYQIKNWSGFWLKLEEIDLTLYRYLTFNIRADGPHIPGEMKIELKRACTQTHDQTTCAETAKYFANSITDSWQPIPINLSEFTPPLSSFTEMGELVFVFDANLSGTEGVVYLDNIVFSQ